MHQKGELETARALYQEILADTPDQVDAHHLLGMISIQTGHLATAVTHLNQAIAVKPDYAEAHFYLANVLDAMDRPDAAIACYDAVIRLAPGLVEAHINRGNVLRQLGRLAEAVSSYRDAIRIRPNHALAHSNCGSALRELRQTEAAVRSYDRAIEIKPDYTLAYFNRGVVLGELRRIDAALASYDAALAIEAGFADAHYFKALLLLLRGDFVRGWVEHEWRWGSRQGSFEQERRAFPRPVWLGERPVANRTVLLYAEQGLGDTIQFCRYASLVAELGAQVILEVPEGLAGVVARIEGVSRVLSRGTALPAFDYQCPLMSLPLAFRTTVTTIPTLPNYLSSDAAATARWREALGTKLQPRVGLVWRGNPRNPNDGIRSISLDVLVKHLPGGFQYVSLQKDLTDLDRETLIRNPHILNIGSRLNDFEATAAVCECMDLVISVDTSVAHLSAALGRPTWILLAFACDWRWMLDRSDTPWYPTARLYRQRRESSWPEVLTQVAANLKKA